MAKYRNVSDEKGDLIMALFYRTELRLGEKVIDNRDCAIAKEVGLDITTVSNCITHYLNQKYEEFNQKINNSK